jgi:hypothetical protein
MGEDATHDDKTTVPLEDRARLLCVLRRASDPRWSFAYRNSPRAKRAGAAAAWSCMRVMRVSEPGE